jgi:hypothetical protein
LKIYNIKLSSLNKKLYKGRKGVQMKSYILNYLFVFLWVGSLILTTISCDNGLNANEKSSVSRDTVINTKNIQNTIAGINSSKLDIVNVWQITSVNNLKNNEKESFPRLLELNGENLIEEIFIEISENKLRKYKKRTIYNYSNISRQYMLVACDKFYDSNQDVNIKIDRANRKIINLYNNEKLANYKIDGCRLKLDLSNSLTLALEENYRLADKVDILGGYSNIKKDLIGAWRKYLIKENGISTEYPQINRLANGDIEEIEEYLKITGNTLVFYTKRTVKRGYNQVSEDVTYNPEQTINIEIDEENRRLVNVSTNEVLFHYNYHSEMNELTLRLPEQKVFTMYVEIEHLDIDNFISL